MKKNPLGSGKWRKPETRSDRMTASDWKRWKSFERALAEKGIESTRDRRKKPTRRNLPALKKKWEEYAQYLNPENNFAFVRLRRGDKRRKLIADRIPKDALTKKGAFVRRPKTLPGQRMRTKVRITAKGEILGSVGLNQRRVTVSLSARELARDPHGAIEKALDKADKSVPSRCRRVGVLLKVHGHNLRERGQFSVNQFFQYMAGGPGQYDQEEDEDFEDRPLLEQLRDPNRRDRAGRKGRMTYKQIAETFTVEVVYSCEAKRRRLRRMKRVRKS